MQDWDKSANYQNMAARPISEPKYKHSTAGLYTREELMPVLIEGHNMFNPEHPVYTIQGVELTAKQLAFIELGVGIGVSCILGYRLCWTAPVS